MITFLASRLRIGAYLGANGWLPLRAGIEHCAAPNDLALFFSEALDLRIPAPTTGEPHLDTPIILLHTSDDEIVDVELGHQARNVLGRLGFHVRWKEENQGGHLSILETQGLDSISMFLKEVTMRDC